MKALVIGAGPSGLVTLKELREAGVDCAAVEEGPRIGGAFDIDRPNPAVYDSTVLTTSNYFMAYSSMPPDLREPRRFWTHRQYIDYLGRFARRFALEPHVRFGTTVTRVEPRADGVRVELRDAEGPRSERYDAVAIATGINRAPALPDIPGLDGFDGECLHAQGYRNAVPFRDRRVLCIGLGETGADLATEVAGVASAVMLSVRRVPAIIERYPAGELHPGDAYTSRAMGVLDHRTLSARYMALYRRELAAARTPFTRRFAEWNLRSAGRFGQWYTKNEAALHAHVEGRLAVNLSGIERVQGSTVIFRDGARFEADVILCSTGYRLEHPASSWMGTDARDLFKMMIHPEVGCPVAFIGWVRPDLGGVPTCAELQARYWVELLAGRRSLPDPDALRATIERDRALLAARFCNAGGPPTVVPYSRYCDDLARLIGCHPLEDGRIREPALLARLWFGSQIGAQYRLVGPGAQPELARQTLMRLPIAYSKKSMLELGSRALADRIPLVNRALARRDTRRMRSMAADMVARHGGEVMPFE